MQAASGQALPACLLAAASLLATGTADSVSPDLPLGLRSLAQQLLSNYASTLSQALNLSNRALCNAALALLASVAGLGPLQSQAVLAAIQWVGEALQQMASAPRCGLCSSCSGNCHCSLLSRRKCRPGSDLEVPPCVHA